MAKTTKPAKKTAPKKLKKTAVKATAQTASRAPAITLRLPPDVHAALMKSMGAANALDDDSPTVIAYNLISALQTQINAQIPTVFTTQPVNLFGLPNNLLDPLNFNGTVAVGTSGTVCLPQSCTSFPLVGEVCVPPDWLACASASASAYLSSLTGLSTLRIASFNLGTPTVNGNSASVTGGMTITGQVLSANGGANASGGVAGFSIPISTSASGSLSNYNVELTITVSFNLAPPQLTAITINTLGINVVGVPIVNIGDLGPFNSLFSPLLFALSNAFGWNGVLSSALSNALQGVLQNMINSQL
jgi:hypothetical protein